MPKLQLSSELRDALRACGPYFLFAGLFSLAINILYLTSPIYMMQVYDRVLGSGSEATLIMLTLACCLALAVLAGLDNVRSAVLTRAGIRFDAALSHRVVSAMVDRANASRGMERGQALRDLDTFRQFITGSTVHALFDAPWSPLYIIVEFLVHPLLGIFATTFAVILFGLAVSNEYLTRKHLGQANEASIRNYAFTESSLRNAEVIRALGMLDGLLRRWGTDRQKLVGMQAIASDRGATINSLIKFLRMFMQSLMLGAGAYLVIERQITPGSMFACTLLLGRALQPIEQTVGAWKFLVSARAAFNRVDRLLTDTPAPVLGMSLPRPNGELNVDRMTFAPPGSQRAILNNITFALKAGESLGIIGPSAAGKSTLARLLVGVHNPNIGIVRLDGANIFTWSRADIGPHIGYLPQDIELFSGTVAENIARFSAPNSEQIVAAANAAGVHEMILRLPNGYDTQISEAGAFLSAGQRQRIALARAVYGNPCLVVLDEPNSNLDLEGEQALSRCIAMLKQSGTTTIIISHRPSVIESVDKLLILQNGSIDAFGPRTEIMARFNRPSVVRPIPAGQAGLEAQS